MERELERLRGRGLRVNTDPDVLPFLVRRGYHPRLGARPMRDAVEKHLRDACVDAILACLQFPTGVLRVAGERLILDGSVPLADRLGATDCDIRDRSGDARCAPRNGNNEI
jgi:hypothetical protein